MEEEPPAASLFRYHRSLSLPVCAFGQVGNDTLLRSPTVHRRTSRVHTCHVTHNEPQRERESYMIPVSFSLSLVFYLENLLSNCKKRISSCSCTLSFPPVPSIWHSIVLRETWSRSFDQHSENFVLLLLFLPSARCSCSSALPPLVMPFLPSLLSLNRIPAYR